MEASNINPVGEVLPDIATREDITLVMREFYVLMLNDAELRPIFIDVAHIDLEEHLPVLAEFWMGVLFGQGTYANNPMTIHQNLHRKMPLTKRHFDLWLGHLHATIDAYFKGDMADLMKTRALSIATVMQIKLAQMA